VRDANWLIHSTSAGTPANAAFQYLHWVRRSDNPHMSDVAQMAAGGAVPQDDCAPAVVLSRQRDDGRNPSMRTLERLCGTGGRGTSEVNLRNAYLALGYQAHISYTSPAVIGWIENTAWGGKVSPAQNGPYLAAFTGTSVIIDTPGGWETSAPTPPLQEADDMGASFVLPDNSAQVNFWLDGAGHIHEAWYTTADQRWHGPVDATMGWFKGVLAAGGLSACVTPDGGAQLVFWTGRDGHRYEAWYTGVWNGPIIIPNT
jgi:hypothetical protein